MFWLEEFLDGKKISENFLKNAPTKIPKEITNPYLWRGHGPEEIKSCQSHHCCPGAWLGDITWSM